MRRLRYTWRPSPELARDLPEGFSLTLECLTGPDGIRRFAPEEPLGAFIAKAALGGEALLSRLRSVDAHERYGLRVNRLLYQLGPGLREHLGRSFRRAADLSIPAKARIGQDDDDILPTDLGLGPSGRGRGWTPAELLKHGRAKAAEAGCARPDQAACIRYGLLSAAQENPVDAGGCRGDAVLVMPPQEVEGVARAQAVQA
jgi:hypothetical protein